MKKVEYDKERIKPGTVVKFWLTNGWHYGIVSKVGWKWVTISYRNNRKHKILWDNIKTEIFDHYAYGG